MMLIAPGVLSELVHCTRKDHNSIASCPKFALLGGFPSGKSSTLQHTRPKVLIRNPNILRLNVFTPSNTQGYPSEGPLAIIRKCLRLTLDTRQGPLSNNSFIFLSYSIIGRKTTRCPRCLRRMTQCSAHESRAPHPRASLPRCRRPAIPFGEFGSCSLD